ncbi:hypothetical protein ACFQE1_20230, partial [Halobium palmae]
ADGPDDGLREVRAAYRDTVMGMAHYDDEYGEPLATNMAAEFSEELAGAVADGTAWFVSAGNSGDAKHWSGRWNDPDGDDWLNFEGSRETSGVILPAPYNERHSDVSLSLQWDQWPQATGDYDLYLTNTTSMDCTDQGAPTFCEENVVASSTIPQDGFQEPWELVSTDFVDSFSAASYESGEGPKFYFAVRAEDAEGDARFDLFAGDDHRLTDDATPAGSVL